MSTYHFPIDPYSNVGAFFESVEQDTDAENEDINPRWHGRKLGLIIGTATFLIATITAVFTLAINAWKINSMSEETAIALINQKFAGEYIDSNGQRIIFHEKIKELEQQGIKTKAKILSRLALCHESEANIIKYVLVHFDLTNCTNKEGQKIDADPIQVMVWMLHGAHVHVKDDADAYEAWKKFKEAVLTQSSHPFKTGQYAIQGYMFKNFLFGDLEVKNIDLTETYSWFQLENHPITNLFTFILHMGDYLKYKWTGKNQGPYGSSEFTEKNPLVISQKQGYIPV